MGVVTPLVAGSILIRVSDILSRAVTARLTVSCVAGWLWMSLYSTIRSPQLYNVSHNYLSWNSSYYKPELSFLIMEPVISHLVSAAWALPAHPKNLAGPQKAEAAKAYWHPLVSISANIRDVREEGDHYSLLLFFKVWEEHQHSISYDKSKDSPQLDVIQSPAVSAKSSCAGDYFNIAYLLVALEHINIHTFIYACRKCI